MYRKTNGAANGNGFAESEIIEKRV